MAKLTLILLILLLAIPPVFAQSNQSETLTISTYYPSPYGVYRNLEVKGGMAVGGSGYSTVNNLKEGQLFINNSMVLNTLSTTPPNSEGKAGQVIYVGTPDKMIKYHDGTKWLNATLTPPPCPPGKQCYTTGSSESCPLNQICRPNDWVAPGSTYVSTLTYFTVCCLAPQICGGCQAPQGPSSCPAGSHTAWTATYKVGENPPYYFTTTVLVCVK